MLLLLATGQIASILGNSIFSEGNVVRAIPWSVAFGPDEALSESCPGSVVLPSCQLFFGLILRLLQIVWEGRYTQPKQDLWRGGAPPAYAFHLGPALADDLLGEVGEGKFFPQKV